MSSQSDDLQKRRAQRMAQKNQLKKQKRKLIFRFSLAGGVLLLGIVLVLFLTKPDRIDTPPSPQESISSQPDAQSPNTVIHLAAAGDLNINDAVVAAGGMDLDYTDAFMDVGSILAHADISVLNFEGNLCGAPYGSASLSAPQALVQALRNVGVDALQLANSYPINQGMSGLSATINAVQAAGLEPLGAYGSKAALQEGKGYSIREVNGVRIAFVAFTKGMNGMRLPAGNEGFVNVLYTDYDSTYQTIDTDGITRILSSVQESKPDLTVALLHWGSEFNNTVSDSQKSIVKLLRDNGVDAIIGTHSHYVQKMEYDSQSGDFLAYSLGDFFGDAQRAGSEYSVILDLEITKNNRSGDTKITNFSYTPIFTVNEKDKPLRIVRIHEAMLSYEQGYINRVSPQTYEAMKYALERIEARISGENE